MRATLLLVVAACGAQAGPRSDLQVVDFHGAPPIEIRFDRPVGGPIDAWIVRLPVWIAIAVTAASSGSGKM